MPQQRLDGVVIPPDTTGDGWATPAWLLRMFEGWDDPCLPGRTDGLTRPWGPRTYVNPPYSNPLPWVKKAILEHAGGGLVVMLLKHDSSTEWYRLLHEAGARFFACIGRIQFEGAPTGANFPSVLVVL